MDKVEDAHLGSLSEVQISIVGIARDVEHSLTKSVEIIERAFTDARGARFFVVESNSKDDTARVLKQLRDSRDNFDYISLQGLEDGMTKRTERLALCRNTYLDYLLTLKLGSNSLVAVVDLDGVNNQLTTDAIKSCFTRSDWDVVSANQKGRYYDIWALREDSWCPNDYLEFSRFLQDLGHSRLMAYRRSLRSKQIKIPQSAGWLPVRSAFGGLALYRPWTISVARYAGSTTDGKVVSEHVPFHEALDRAGARMFINPTLINAHSTEHTGSVRLLSRQFRRLFESV